MEFIPQLLPSALAFPFSCMKHACPNTWQWICSIMSKSPASALCSHGSPTSPVSFFTDNYTFCTGDLIKIITFSSSCKWRTISGSSNWCSVFFLYPLKTLLFKNTEYICHLEMKLWRYLQCFICLFNFVYIRLYILHFLYASTFHLHL